MRTITTSRALKNSISTPSWSLVPSSSSTRAYKFYLEKELLCTIADGRADKAWTNADVLCKGKVLGVMQAYVITRITAGGGLVICINKCIGGGFGSRFSIGIMRIK